jgi:hypothetical protein
MEKEFVTYELALRMKQLVFDEPCLAFYGDENDFSMDSSRKNNPFRKTECVAPLFQQAFRWFREKHRLKHIWVMDELLDTGEYTYDEAELACLKYCIEIVEQKNKKDETN